MKLRSISLILLSLFIFLSFADAMPSGYRQGYAWKPVPPEQGQFVPGRILVKFKTELQMSQSPLKSDVSLQMTMPGAVKGNALGSPGWFVVEIPSSMDPLSACEQIKQNPSVMYAEPDYYVQCLIAEPNDYDWNAYVYDEFLIGLDEPFPYMWSLGGAGTGMINALDAWSIWPNTYYTANTKSRDAVKLAVIDSGIDQGHPEFMNEGGFSTDAVLGGQLDVVNSAGFTYDTKGYSGWNDEHGHGTHVAGIAAASGNNGTPLNDGHGIIGVGYNAQIMSLQVVTPSGSGTLSDTADAIMWAVRRGATVINMSIGDPAYSQLLQDVVTYAWNSGILIVAAANEDGVSGSKLDLIFPAACSKVLAVTASGPEMYGFVGLASYAASGQYVGLIAPGGDAYFDTFLFQLVWSTAPRYNVTLTDDFFYFNNYGFAMGTSMASPHVAGAAALFAEAKGIRYSTPYGNLRTYQALQRGATNIDGSPNGIWSSTSGHGLLNVQSALQEVNFRTATKGCVTGQVYKDAIPTQGIMISAKKVGSSETSSTTTYQYGYYRLTNMTAGTWDITVNYTETKRINVVVGADTPGVDFWLGSPVPDTTPPVDVVVWDDGAFTTSTTQLNAKWFARDFESSCDQFEYSVGTSPGAVNTKGWTFVGNSTQETISVSMTAGNTYYINVRAKNGAKLTTIGSSDGIRCGSTPFRVVSGKVTLNDYIRGVSAGHVMTLEVRQPGTTNMLESHTVMIENGGVYSFQITRTDVVDISLKYANWLRVTQSNVNLNVNVTGLNFELPNGDSNNDNSIDDFDLLDVIGSFGSYGDNPGDLTKDGIIDDFDLAIVNGSFGSLGDN